MDWWGLGNAANARKKTSGNAGNGWASGCATPPNRTTEPLHPARTRPPFRWALVGAGRGYRGAVHWFFLRLQAQFFFFFSAKPGPCPHTLGGYFRDFFSDSPVRIQCDQWSPEKSAEKFSRKNPVIPNTPKPFSSIVSHAESWRTPSKQEIGVIDHGQTAIQQGYDQDTGL